MAEGKSLTAAGGLVVGAPVLVIVLVMMMLGGEVAPAGAACAAPGASVSGTTVPGEIAGYSGVQLENAGAIISAAKALDLPLAAQVIGVQAAMGESGLEVIDRGDAAGPDSRGLFQQRDNGAWGSYTDRMDPTISSTNFFKVLQEVPGWESLESSLAINRVQRNSDPGHYRKYREPAEAVVNVLTGVDTSKGAVCAGGGGAVIGNPTGQWVFPLSGEGAIVSSGYGPRETPAGTADINNGFHYGVDLSSGSAADVVAPTDMRITRTTPAANDQWGAGENVAGTTLDGQYSIAFFHMVTGSTKVKVGDVVAAGTPLGVMGATGNVSGAHVHVEMYSPALDNPLPALGTVNPVPIFEKAGAWR